MRSKEPNRIVRKTRATLGVLAIVIALVEFGAHAASAFSGQSETQALPDDGKKSSAEGQQQAGPSIPRITFGEQSGTPGGNVVVPLFYTPARGLELRSVTVEVEWVSKNLRFARLDRGIAAEMIGANVTAKVTGTSKDAKAIEHSTLRIDVSEVDENPKKGLPEGLLAYLTFQISPDAQPFSIELRAKQVSATEIGTGAKKIAKVKLENGKVNVESPGLPAYVTCFFFSH